MRTTTDEMSFTVFFLLLQLIPVFPGAVLLNTYNMILIKENSGVSLQQYWNLNETDNDPEGDKHVRPIYTLIPLGNFRSKLIDEWDTNPPQEIAILFFNNIGDLQFWMFFNTRDVGADVTSWMTPDRLMGSMSYGMRQDATEAIWSSGGYQYVLKKRSLDQAWFAISNRNIHNGNKEFPFFVVPISSSRPFAIVQENLTVGEANNGLLYSFGPYLKTKSVEVQVGTTNSVFINRIEVPIMSRDNTSRTNYKLQYSQQDCGTAERTDYRNNNAMVMELSAGKLENIEQLYVKCMWVTFHDTIDEISINLYGPTGDDFVTLPVVVFRGFWYGEKHSHDDKAHDTTTNQPVKEMSTALDIKNQSTRTGVPGDITGVSSDVRSDGTAVLLLLTTAATPNNTYLSCDCPHVSKTIHISQTELLIRIHNIQEKLRVNKSNLSSHKRKLISMGDDRASAKSIGCVAGSVLFLIVLTIMILDLSTLHKEFCHLKSLL